MGTGVCWAQIPPGIRIMSRRNPDSYTCYFRRVSGSSGRGGGDAGFTDGRAALLGSTCPVSVEEPLIFPPVGLG